MARAGVSQGPGDRAIVSRACACTWAFCLAAGLHCTKRMNANETKTEYLRIRNEALALMGCPFPRMFDDRAAALARTLPQGGTPRIVRAAREILAMVREDFS